MIKINNKGFTLVEVLAVIAIIALLGLIAVPGVLNSINNSKKSSYNIMLSDIKIAGETLFEEIEYNDSDLYQYNDDGTKLTTKIKIEHVSDDSGNLSITQIQTNLQTLVSNGILKGTQTEKNGKKIPILTNPTNDKNIGFCKINIRKVTDSNQETKTIYEFISDNTSSYCPKTYAYQATTKTEMIGNYRESTKGNVKYYFLNNGYKYYQYLILNADGNLDVPSNESTFQGEKMIYATDNSQKLFLINYGQFYQSYKISLTNSSTNSRTISDTISYRYSSTVKITSIDEYESTITLQPASLLYIPTLNKHYTFFDKNDSSATLKVNYLNKITKLSSNGSKSTYKVEYTQKKINKLKGDKFIFYMNYYPNSSSYTFNKYNGTYKLSGTIDNKAISTMQKDTYTCLSSSISCTTLYKIINIQRDSILLETYSNEKLTS